MPDLFSDLGPLWSAGARAPARPTRLQRLMAAFHVLRDIRFAAPWDGKGASRRPIG